MLLRTCRYGMLPCTPVTLCCQVLPLHTGDPCQSDLTMCVNRQARLPADVTFQTKLPSVCQCCQRCYRRLPNDSTASELRLQPWLLQLTHEQRVRGARPRVQAEVLCAKLSGRAQQGRRAGTVASIHVCHMTSGVSTAASPGAALRLGAAQEEPLLPQCAARLWAGAPHQRAGGTPSNTCMTRQAVHEARYVCRSPFEQGLARVQVALALHVLPAHTHALHAPLAAHANELNRASSGCPPARFHALLCLGHTPLL